MAGSPLAGRFGWWSRAGHIRSRLIGLTVVAGLPIVAMAGTIAWQNYQSIARGAQERASLLDGQALAQYDAAFGVVTRDLASANAIALCKQAAPDGPALIAADLDGQIVCRSGQLPPDPPPPQRWLEQVRGGEPVSLSRYGPGGWTAVAVPTPGAITLAAVLPPAWAATQLLADMRQPGDALWLMDEEGAVVASRGDAPQALPTTTTMANLAGQDQAALRARSARGGQYAYATTRLPGGWRLLAATSARREYAQALQGTLIELAELAALLFAGLVSVVLGADVAFGQPLRRLSAAVRRWQDGAGFEPGELKGAPDEVQLLAASFAEATAVLRQREAELVRSRAQQELLVMEVHHRVKNNLQVVASLLNLQASRIRVPEARAEFQAARDRVRALATLHRHLYADGDLHTINMRSFLAELCGQLFQALGETANDRIAIVIQAPELRMSSDQAVPLALIVTEAVTNAVRYAFPGDRGGRVEVSLTAHADGLDLVISDDGVGIEASRDADDSERDGIGLQLIRGFSRQLGATLSVEQGQGTRYAVRLRHPAAAAATPAPVPA